MFPISQICQQCARELNSIRQVYKTCSPTVGTAHHRTASKKIISFIRNLLCPRLISGRHGIRTRHTVKCICLANRLLTIRLSAVIRPTYLNHQIREREKNRLVHRQYTTKSSFVKQKIHLFYVKYQMSASSVYTPLKPRRELVYSYQSSSKEYSIGATLIGDIPRIGKLHKGKPAFFIFSTAITYIQSKKWIAAHRHIPYPRYPRSCNIAAKAARQNTLLY